jgi:hypothetical protein
MKTTLALLCFSFLTSAAVFAQDRGSDSTLLERGKTGKPDSIFVDRDGNGIDDRQERSGGKGVRGKDRFVDSDGDGICDGRAGGLGLRFRGGAGGGKGKGGNSRGGGRK